MRSEKWWVARGYKGKKGQQGHKNKKMLLKLEWDQIKDLEFEQVQKIVKNEKITNEEHTKIDSHPLYPRGMMKTKERTKPPERTLIKNYNLNEPNYFGGEGGRPPLGSFKINFKKLAFMTITINVKIDIKFVL